MDASKVEQAIQKVCDGYCKYVDEYTNRYADPDDASERMAIERCEDCPLNVIAEEVM